MKPIEFTKEPTRLNREWLSKCGRYLVREVPELSLPFRVFKRAGKRWKYRGATDRFELVGKVAATPPSVNP